MYTLYQNVRRYLYNREPKFFADICHDAYLAYYRTTGNNLYEQSPKVAYTVAKRTLYEFWRSLYWQQNGKVIGKRNFQEFQEGIDGFTGHSVNFTTPYEELELTELRERLDKFLESIPEDKSVFLKDNNLTKKIVSLRFKGYTNKEISEHLNISKGLVTYYLKNVNFDMLQNPFNGNPTKVVKRIKRNTYESNPEYRENYEVGDGADSNEYYTLLTSKTNPSEGLLIKESDD